MTAEGPAIEGTGLLPPAARRLLPTILPAIVVGIGSALSLLVVSAIASRLEGILWEGIPSGIGIDWGGPLWILLMLTLVGLAIGLIVTFVPGHAGPDPATVELAGSPLPLAVLPGLALALVVMLAGGVSLGPENPIIGINVGLAVALGARLLSRIGAGAWAAFAFAGTIGAMFGTPVAAALLLTETGGDPKEPVWDRIFGPLVAAAAGSLTLAILNGESFALAVTPYPGPQPIDLLSASIIAVASAVIGLVAILAFRLSYRVFRRLGPPLVTLVVGGVMLGLLGALGGPITLFKGLEQMKELSASAGTYTAAGLAAIGAIKLVALVVAATSGFRGGRIFPAVFVGVAFGLAVDSAFPAIPQALAVAASIAGMLVAVTRSGWLALFLSAFMVGETAMLPIILVAVLPAWLVVTGRPEMVIPRTGPPAGQGSPAILDAP
jgi:H+/Cl- antiporter ClcA